MQSLSFRNQKDGRQHLEDFERGCISSKNLDAKIARSIDAFLTNVMILKIISISAHRAGPDSLKSAIAWINDPMLNALTKFKKCF